MRIAMLLIMMCAWVGCSRQEEQASAAVDLSPQNAEVESCSACGMVIREQPAPRGQVIHRDGTRVFLCSVSDLLQYIHVPSPHGKPAVVYTEALAGGHLPENMDKSWQTWAPVDELHYVVGIDRMSVMGAAVMAYASAEDASQCAKVSGGETIDFATLEKRMSANE